MLLTQLLQSTVAIGAEALQVLVIPEEQRIASVRSYVVNYRCLCYAYRKPSVYLASADLAFVLTDAAEAQHTQRMPGKMASAHAEPSGSPVARIALVIPDAHV